jgi:hypothetical protein
VGISSLETHRIWWRLGGLILCGIFPQTRSCLILILLERIPCPHAVKNLSAHTETRTNHHSDQRPHSLILINKQPDRVGIKYKLMFRQHWSSIYKTGYWSRGMIFASHHLVKLPSGSSIDTLCERSPVQIRYSPFFLLCFLLNCEFVQAMIRDD